MSERECRWLLDDDAPFYTQGCIGGYVGRCTDGDARILIDELSHRLKNTLAVVHAMAVQSFRGERPVEQSLAAFESRLCALARSQQLLSTHTRSEVALHGVVETTIAPYDPDGTRVRWAGAPLLLCPDAAAWVAMAVHELLTNAVKYGALSVPGGTVQFGWTYDTERQVARMAWEESNGPPVVAPSRKGFGTRFIEGARASGAHAATALAFDPGGVRCVLEARARETSPAR